jgi:glycosyltransferase involved in cell wall biosynthesis
VRTAAAATVGVVPILTLDSDTWTGDTNKLFEYLMAGLPVAASDIPEIRRVLAVGDPPAGELFDATSPASIASAVTRILQDKDTYLERRKRARALALSEHNWNAQESRLTDMYSSLLAGKRHRPSDASPNRSVTYDETTRDDF